MKMKIYHLSDLHLGARPPGRSEISHRQMVFTKLQETIDKARKEGVKFIVICGDIFHSNAVPGRVVSDFFEILLEAKGIHFVIIPGGGRIAEDEVFGHDAYTEDSLYRRVEVKKFLQAENISFLSPDEPQRVIDNVGFYGGFFDYPKAEKIVGCKYHIALLHGSFGNNEDYGEIFLDERILSEYDYVALGHYHTFKRIGRNACYSGAFIQFEYVAGRDATSGYVEVELPEKGMEDAVIKRVEFQDAPRYVYMKILGESDAEAFRSLDFLTTHVKISMYLEDYKDLIREKQAEYPDKIVLLDGCCIPKDRSKIAETIDEILYGNSTEIIIPEEHREEVRETILYGLWISSKKSDFENFLRNLFGLD